MMDVSHLMSIQSRESIRLYRIQMIRPNALTPNYDKYGLAARAVDTHPLIVPKYSKQTRVSQHRHIDNYHICHRPARQQDIICVDT